MFLFIWFHLAKSVTFQPIKHTKANQNKMWIQAETGEAFRVKTKREGELIKEIS